MVNPRIISGIYAAIVVLGMVSSSSCWFRKSPAVFTPPPPQAQPKVAETPRLPEPPVVAADPDATLPPTPNSVPEAPAPPKPAPQPKKQTAPPVAPRPATPVVPDQPEPPTLTRMFTPEERRDFNKQIDDSLEKVRRALTTLSKKNLNPDQQAQINTISTFQKQAEQSREAQDLTTAVSLAKRAEVLAEDLLNRLP